ncbi:hypothetical protein VTL71DRAFT_15817 [Oculimacula yallundae]|uniref:DUF1996 domain-containing protein n=1 Tax=Oculimacula yallundae TaxID=86028 RepID=A0ABR4CCP5_9HELO
MITKLQSPIRLRMNQPLRRLSSSERSLSLVPLVSILSRPIQSETFDIFDSIVRMPIRFLLDLKAENPDVLDLNTNSGKSLDHLMNPTGETIYHCRILLRFMEMEDRSPALSFGSSPRSHSVNLNPMQRVTDSLVPLERRPKGAGGFRIELMFPSCWNGKGRTPPDKRSHVACPSQAMTGECKDKNFPIRLPSMLYETIWATNASVGRARSSILSKNQLSQATGATSDVPWSWIRYHWFHSNAALLAASLEATNTSSEEYQALMHKNGLHWTKCDHIPRRPIRDHWFHSKVDLIDQLPWVLLFPKLPKEIQRRGGPKAP